MTAQTKEMNKPTNEELSRIFAAYWGAEVKVNGYFNNDSTPKLIIEEMTGVLPYGVQSAYEDMTLPFSNCQLHLYDLSQISEQDAIEVCELAGISYIDVYGARYVCEDIYSRVMSKYMPKIIDYLRSKHYNIGYGKWSAADLVEMNLVTIKTQKPA